MNTLGGVLRLSELSPLHVYEISKNKNGKLFTNKVFFHILSPSIVLLLFLFSFETRTKKNSRCSGPTCLGRWRPLFLVAFGHMAFVIDANDANRHILFQFNTSLKFTFLRNIFTRKIASYVTFSHVISFQRTDFLNNNFREIPFPNFSFLCDTPLYYRFVKYISLFYFPYLLRRYRKLLYTSRSV